MQFSIFRFQTPIVKPLVIFLAWYDAEPRHVAKYAEIYINQGFDVVTVRFSSLEVFRPKSKVQV